MRYFVFLLILLLLSCKSLRSSESKINSWYTKDLFIDSIPGISLDKWYKQNNKNVKSSSIIVAVIDTQLDIEHEDLKDQIWINKKEIDNNKIDDDNNGYVDDVNGWNFLGTKNGNYVVWANFEYVRFIRKWKPFFDNKKIEDIAIENQDAFKTYKWSVSLLDYYQKYYQTFRSSFGFLAKMYPKAKDTLKCYFPKEDYSLSQLDSMYAKYKLNDKTFEERKNDNDEDFGALIEYVSVAHSYNNKSVEDLKDKLIQYDSIFNKNLNIEYNERELIGDNEFSLEKGYGNSKVNAKIEGIRSLNTHSTKVSGIIASNRNNRIGTNGFSNKIKIMPLVISPSGDEHDKDIANAIYYAVDNGAKIINMSFGKEFSLEKKWTFDAYKYAEEHNVLIVHISGNDKFDIDKNPFYPNDNDYINKKEVVGNFINVGSISKRTDSTMVSPFSNYGKENVDIFAPGEEIYVAKPNNEYGYDSGTSLAGPMVSGTAALLWLYYPNLTVHQMKSIILESGVSIDKMVIKPGTKDEMVPFSDLSKTGKVLNAYNAFLLAKKVSKQK